MNTHAVTHVVNRHVKFMRMAFEMFFFFSEGIWGQLDKIGMDGTIC